MIRCVPQLTQEKLGKVFENNAVEWTGRVEISKEEIPGIKSLNNRRIRLETLRFVDW